MSHPVWAHDDLLPVRGDVDVARYRLSETENAAIYQTVIAPQYFSRAKASAHPTLIIVTGQPGSGKSTLVQKIHAENALSDFVSIEKDSLHVFHPRHASLRVRAQYFPNADTLKDADSWFEKLIAEAFHRKVNVVLHRSGVVPGTDLGWLSVPRALGYRIEINAIATAFSVSEQSAVERYEVAKSEGPGARMSCRENHCKYYDRLPRALDEVEQRRLAERITVVNRRGDVLYDNTLTDGTWLRPVSAARVLTTERDRPLSTAELEEQCARVARTVARMETNGSRVDDPSRYDKMLALLGRVCPATAVAGTAAATAAPLAEGSVSVFVSPFGTVLQPL